MFDSFDDMEIFPWMLGNDNVTNLWYCVGVGFDCVAISEGRPHAIAVDTDFNPRQSISSLEST